MQFIKSYPKIYNFIIYITNLLLIWNFLNFILENPIKCILLYFLSSTVLPFLCNNKISKSIRSFIYKKFENIIILFNYYSIGFSILTLIFIIISPYSIIFKEMSLIMSCILFILYGIVILYYIEIKNPKLQKENPLFYLVLLTISIILLILGVICLYEFVELMRKSIVFYGSMPNSPSNNNTSNNSPNNSPNPGNNNSGNVIGDLNFNNRDRREDSNGSESENSESLVREDFNPDAEGKLKYLEHKGSLLVSKVISSSGLMENLLKNINRNRTELIKIVKREYNYDSKKDIVLRRGYLIKNGQTLSEQDLRNVKIIFYRGQRALEKSRINSILSNLKVGGLANEVKTVDQYLINDVEENRRCLSFAKSKWITAYSFNFKK